MGCFGSKRRQVVPADTEPTAPEAAGKDGGSNEVQFAEGTGDEMQRDSLRDSAKVGSEASRSSRAMRNDQSGGGVACGAPFPKRSMTSKLSAKTYDKVEELFRLMDEDGSNAVTREEAKAFFSGSFAKMSVDAMFNEVDTDGSGAITADEFVNFWQQVRSSGYKDQDILDEIGELLEGAAWVDWKDGRNTTVQEVKFPKRPILCRLSAKTWGKCEELFHKISSNDEKMQITREKAKNFFQGSFVNISVDAMFNEIDVDHHGIITAKDFMHFWVQLRSHGYKDGQILEELDNLMEGSPWVDWKDGRKT